DLVIHKIGRAPHPRAGCVQRTVTRGSRIPRYLRAHMASLVLILYLRGCRLPKDAIIDVFNLLYFSNNFSSLDPTLLGVLLPFLKSSSALSMMLMNFSTFAVLLRMPTLKQPSCCLPLTLSGGCSNS